MSVLFLDPLVLGTYAVLGVGIWLVWTGAYRSWFGRGDGWTLAVWPLPVVIGGLPFLVGILSGVLSRLGALPEDGGAQTGAAYLAVYLALGVWSSVFPPRWLLPPWARARCTPLPAADEAPVEGGVPALHAWLGRGHASHSRWVWSVDAAPGHVWVEDDVLRFRAVEGDAADPPFEEIDDLDISQFELQLGDDMHLVPPRGGWWTRRRVDVDLDDVDEVTVSAKRPWSDGGLLTVAVEGRRPVRLWVADVDAVRDAARSAPGPTASR